jgi:hypothetical protein
MRTFRAYLLNAEDKIVWAEWIEARDLPEAEAKAKALCKAGAPTVELWHGERRLSDVPCADGAEPERTAAGEREATR